MIIILAKNCKKQYKKLKPNLQNRFTRRIGLFKTDPFNPILNNHALAGKYKGYRSINVTGDLRAVYKLMEESVAYFVALDTHSNLYR